MDKHNPINKDNPPGDFINDEFNPGGILRPTSIPIPDLSAPMTAAQGEKVISLLGQISVQLHRLNMNLSGGNNDS